MREFIKNVGTVLPEIPKPERKPSLNERFIWSGLALVAYLVMATTPLYSFSGLGSQPAQIFGVIRGVRSASCTHTLPR